MVLSYQHVDAQALPSDLASALRPHALGALAQAPALLPGLVAVGWDAVRHHFVSPLGALELMALDTAVNEAMAAPGPANDQVGVTYDALLGTIACACCGEPLRFVRFLAAGAGMRYTC